MSSLKYWEIIADKLGAAGWSWGHCRAVTRDGRRWIVDAHRKGLPYIVHFDELLSAFLELERRRCSNELWQFRSTIRHRFVKPNGLNRI